MAKEALPPNWQGGAVNDTQPVSSYSRPDMDLDWRKRVDAAWLAKAYEAIQNWRPPDTSFTLKPYQAREVLVSMWDGKMYECRSHNPVLDPDGNHLSWVRT